MTRHQPVHVTARVLKLTSLRGRECYRVVNQALADGCRRAGFRVVEFSVMSNHLHLLCEAQDRSTLARGLQGLFIRIARRLNKHLGRRGRVFADRYRDRVLKTPREVRNALAYVLLNARRHAAERGRRYTSMWVDPCSSARAFFGVVEQKLPAARSWLLSAGWRRAGPIRIDEVPGT
jgi:REP element-mobilizing transposase RayT